MGYTRNPTWVDGVTQANSTTMENIEKGLVAAGGPWGYAQPVGGVRQLGATFQNASSAIADRNTTGTEYALGINFAAMNLDALGVSVQTASSDAGSLLIVALRPIGNDGTIGAPAAQTSFPIDSTGDKLNTFAAVALTAGLYAISWTRIGDASATAKTLSTVATADLIPLAYAPGFPATGHGPSTTVLNTGITGSSVPTSVVMGASGTNGPNYPSLVYRRSA